MTPMQINGAGSVSPVYRFIASSPTREMSSSD